MIYEIETSALTSNPHRDFSINPLQNAQVSALKHSFEQNGDIGVIPVRENPDSRGEYQIVAGHHRVEAMRALGFKFVDCKLVDYDEAQMLIGMIAENATQYGGNPASQLDSIAGAVKMIAYWMMICDDLEGLAQFCAGLFVSDHALQQAKGLLTTKAQIGERTIYALIGNDTLTQPTIRAKLAELNATGHMAKLVKGAFKRVKDETAVADAEAKAIAAEAEKTAKAAEKAEAAAKLAAEARAKQQAELDAQAKLDNDKAAKARLKAEQARLKLEAKQAEQMAELRRKERKRIDEAREKQAGIDKRNQAMRDAQAAANAKTAYLHPDVIGMFENTAQVEMFRNNVKANQALFPEAQQVALVKRMIKGLQGGSEGLSKRSIDAFMDKIVQAHDSEAKQAADNLRKREEKRSKERLAEGVVTRLEQSLGFLSKAMGELQEAAQDKDVANWILNKTGKGGMTRTLDNIERGIPELRKRLNIDSLRGSEVDPSVVKIK